MKLRTLFGLLTLLCSTLLAAEPYVSLPNGELIDRNTDLRVKVLGGSVAIDRTWMNGRWYLNPSWAALKFKLDRSDESVLYVDRIGSVYERTGNGTVYQFDDDQFIRREATGWVWFDRLGNTMHYNDAGVLQHYRNRSGVRDHFGTEVLTVSYTGTVLANVRDYSNRTVHYVYQGALLKEVRNVDNERYLYEYN